MACEVPVVVSDADGFREVVPDGVTGYVVPRCNDEAAAEKILHLLQNPQLAVEMGRSARKHVVENYSWSVSVDKMMSVYDDILSKKSK
jgi:glycosyltransferase involved in cell wall biosynthesis